MGRQRCPLGVQGDVRREGVGRAVGVVRAAAVGSRGPVNEAVASPREGIGRQSRRDVGELVAHRARAAVAVEDHGVVGQSCPLGVQGDVRREGVDRAVGVVCAAAVGSRGPVNEAVASPREGVGRQSRRDVGELVAHRARAAVAVEDHGVVGQSCPLGVQGDVRREGVDRAVGVVCAGTVGGRGPVNKAVASPREGVGRQSRRDVGNLVAHRA